MRVSRLAVVAVALWGCSGGDQPPEPPAPQGPEVYPLGRLTEEARIRGLPGSSRPDGAAAPTSIPIGPFRAKKKSAPGLMELEAPPTGKLLACRHVTMGRFSPG